MSAALRRAQGPEQPTKIRTGSWPLRHLKALQPMVAPPQPMVAPLQPLTAAVLAVSPHHPRRQRPCVLRQLATATAKLVVDVDVRLCLCGCIRLLGVCLCLHVLPLPRSALLPHDLRGACLRLDRSLLLPHPNSGGRATGDYLRHGWPDGCPWSRGNIFAPTPTAVAALLRQSPLLRLPAATAHPRGGCRGRVCSLIVRYNTIPAMTTMARRPQRSRSGYSTIPDYKDPRGGCRGRVCSLTVRYFTLPAMTTKAHRLQRSCSRVTLRFPTTQTHGWLQRSGVLTHSGSNCEVMKNYLWNDN